MIICREDKNDCYFRHEIAGGIPICMYAVTLVSYPIECDKYIPRDEAERRLMTEIAAWKGDK